jgi:predicted dehydrogenase
MKKLFSAIVLSAVLASCIQTTEIIKVDTPARPAGQEDVIGLTAPAMDTVRVGIIGLGMRGEFAVYRFTHIPEARIVAISDLHEDRIVKAQKTLSDAGLPEADVYTGSEDAWKDMCEREDIDLVYIITNWQNHAPMAIYAMEHGKHVAIEVPAALSLDEIWQLINTSERTRKHCMQLENCVYDFFEMTTLNMAQQGVFGEILHAEGAYIHNLEDVWPQYRGNWRLAFNKENRGDVYPTHGFGPICQVLDIHRGDRLKTLVSMDTKAVTGPKMWEKVTGEKCEDFKNADHTLTMISTENGKTMLIEHNTMTPRAYDRMYQITGTDGYANKYSVEQYVIRPENEQEKAIFSAHEPVSAEVKAELEKKYRHPIHIEIEEKAKKVGGHGGMDFVMDYRLIYCLRHGLPLDMDVYDLAEWCSVIELSRISLENGNMPVEVPDFTRGSWNKIKGYRHSYAE